MPRLSTQQHQMFFIQKILRYTSQQQQKSKVNQILNLENAQYDLRSAIARTDQIYLNLKLANRKDLLSETLKIEQVRFVDFEVALQKLDYEDRKPYQQMHRKLEQKIIQHQFQHSLALDNTKQFKKHVVSKRQILFNEQFQHPFIYYSRGFLGLLGTFFLHLIIGSLYRWSMINPYISSFYKITNDPDLTTSRDAIGAPLSMLCVGITMRLGSFLSAQIGTFIILLLTVFATSGCVYLSSQMPSFHLFVIFHNVAFSLCAGMLFVPPINQCIKYFPQFKIIVNTFALVGTGLGSVAFGIINTRCMNPQNYYPSQTGYYSGDLQQIARRMPICFEIMSFWVLGVGIIGILLLSPILWFNKKKNQEKQIEKTYVQRDFQYSCSSHCQALTSSIFWKIAVIILLSSVGNFYIFMNYKSLVKFTIQDQVFLNFLFLAGSLCNGAFRIIWGLTLRKIGFKFIYIIAMLTNILIFSLIPTLVQYQQGYFLLFTLSCIVLGGLMITFSNLCLLVFGVHYGQQIYSYYWICFSFSNFINYLIGNFVTPQLSSFNYTFIIFIGMVILGLVIVLNVEFQGPWENNMNLLTLQNPCQ